MTHDELLAKIDTPNELHVPNADGTTRIYKLKSQHMKALRAVVELHKPESDITYRTICSVCLGAWDNGTPLPVSINYPCLTVQAIEKALGVGE